jgi:uncharacterized protein (DUF1684 family)
MKLIALLLFALPLAAQQKYDAAAVKKFQVDLDGEYADPLKSPLAKEDRAAFKGLDYFNADEAYFVNAKLVRTKDEKPFEMKTTTARRPKYVKYGELSFALKGRQFTLNVYRDVDLSAQPEYADYLFLPFSDLTNGKESYVGGRYIDLKIPQGDTIAIDFNTAYNPYCAYNHKYSCPIVPRDNDLDIEIKAGVKKFHD